MQMSLLHEVLSIHKNIFHMHEFIRHTATACLCPQWQSDYSTTIVTILQKRHIEYFLKWFELILELLNVMSIVLEVKYSYIAAFVVVKAFIGVHKGHLVPTEDGNEVRDVEERYKF